MRFFINGDGLTRNDSTLIHWQVRINYAKENIQKAIYTDIIGGNQNLVSGRFR